MRFTELKNNTIQIIETSGVNEKELNNLINGTIKIFNPNLRVYFNFSRQCYKDIMESCNTIGEYRGIIQGLDPHKQYLIKTVDNYNDYMEYLLEEKEMELYEQMKKQTISHLSDKLFIYELGELNKKHWL